MNKNIFIVAALAVAALAGLMWWGSLSQTAGLSTEKPSANGGLVAEESFYDFGQISMAGGKVEKVFRVTNPTDGEIVVTNVETSCMCTAAFIENGSEKIGPFGMPGHGGGRTSVKEVIKAGEAREIRVIFDPNAHGPAGVGPIDRFVQITEGNGEQLVLAIKGMVKP